MYIVSISRPRGTRQQHILRRYRSSKTAWDVYWFCCTVGIHCALLKDGVMISSPSSVAQAIERYGPCTHKLPPSIPVRKRHRVAIGNQIVECI